MKICAISDLHGYLPGFHIADDRPHDDPFWIEKCDLLLIAGDILPVVDHSLSRQAAWLDGPFRDWLEFIPAKEVVFVAGNHDLIFERAPQLVPSGLRATYLQDSGTEVEGFKIWGSPWQPPFNNWAFNLPEDDLASKWAMIPDDTDILVLHGPPRGYGDKTDDGRPLGSQSLRSRIDEVKPYATVFGHVHEGHGRWETPHGLVANVTMRDAEYRIVHPPIYFNY